MAAAKVRIEIDRAEVGRLLKSQEVQRDLERRAGRIAAQAGPGMEVQSFVGRNRARATIRTATSEARRREATERALTSAIDAGRG